LTGVCDVLAGDGGRGCRDVRHLIRDESVIGVSNCGVYRGIGGQDRLRDPLAVERLEVRIAPTAPTDDDRVDVLRTVQLVIVRYWGLVGGGKLRNKLGSVVLLSRSSGTGRRHDRERSSR
jgi:hypothetical protein